MLSVATFGRATKVTNLITCPSYGDGGREGEVEGGREGGREGRRKGEVEGRRERRREGGKGK